MLQNQLWEAVMQWIKDILMIDRNDKNEIEIQIKINKYKDKKR